MSQHKLGTLGQGNVMRIKPLLSQSKVPLNIGQPPFGQSVLGDNTELLMALSTLPLFGGTEDENENSAVNTTTAETNKTTIAPAGGTEEKQLSPQQISDIIRQNEELQSANKGLLTENNTFKTAQQEAERAKLGREEALSKDLEDRDKTILAMDAALKNQAVINAINSYKDVEFHSIDFVMTKLDPSILENMTVDLDAGTVTITGIENDLKRIANENEWAVKNNAGVTEESKKKTTQQRRPSGAPPPPPGGQNGNQSRREALIDRYPVLAQGRAKIR